MTVNDPIAELLGSWSSEAGWASILFRIALSILIAAVIGCERSSKRHSAGLRTFILITLASTAAMLLDIFAGAILIPAAAMIAIAIISVNSLLFSSRSRIKGLTTSAALWTCGIIGLTCGAGYYTVTLAVSVALLCCLSLFPTFESYLKDRSNHFEVHLELTSSGSLLDFVTTIRMLGLTIDDIELNPAYAGSGLSVYTVSISVTGEELKRYKTHKEIIEALSTLEYVHHIEEMRG